MNATREAALASSGLTRREWDALLGLHYSHFEPPESLALYVVGELALARSFNPDLEIGTADEYLAALRQLQVHGWVKIVRDSPEKRSARYAAAGIFAPPVESLAEAGCLDFTARGYRLSRRIERAMGFEAIERLAWADERAQTLSCIAGTKRACRAWLDDLRNPLGGGLWGFYYPVRLACVSGLERVGSWKPREAAPTRQRGWRVTVHVRRVRRRRLSIPELGVEGWITPTETLEIGGSVRGVRFCFRDGVAATLGSTPLYQATLTVRDGKRDAGTPIQTTLGGQETLAATLFDGSATHFRWSEPEHPERARALTPEEAIACLKRGLTAWQDTRYACSASLRS